MLLDLETASADQTLPTTDRISVLAAANKGRCSCVTEFDGSARRNMSPVDFTCDVDGTEKACSLFSARRSISTRTLGKLNVLSNVQFNDDSARSETMFG